VLAGDGQLDAGVLVTGPIFSALRDGMMDDIVKDFLKSRLADHILICGMDYKAVVQGREDEIAGQLKQYHGIFHGAPA